MAALSLQQFTKTMAVFVAFYIDKHYNGFIEMLKNEGCISIDKQLPMGLRKPPNHVLSDDEIKSLIDDIRAIGADVSVFVFNSTKVRATSYRPQDDIIYVKGNVLSDCNSKHPRDIMSQRAVLAHEYYGHRPYRQQYLDEYERNSLDDDTFLSKIASQEWCDEFRASYMAAKNTPQLSDEDRRYLVLDAIERAKESNVSIKYNAFMREVLYGYN